MTSFVDIVRPINKTEAKIFDCFVVFGGSLLIALLSQLAIPLWFTPVPITMQSFGVLLLGCVLGKNKAALAVICFLAEGALGLPFFSGGTCGLLALMGPRGGYLFGFVVAAYLTGLLFERGPKEKFSYAISTMSVGAFCILFFGALWLSLFVGGIQPAIALGVAPFIAGECLKIGLAATIIPAAWRLMPRT